MNKTIISQSPTKDTSRDVTGHQAKQFAIILDPKYI